MATGKTPRDDVINLRLTEREFTDLCRIAQAEDRKPAEMAWVMVRSYMYGRLRAVELDCEGAKSASDAR